MRPGCRSPIHRRREKVAAGLFQRKTLPHGADGGGRFVDIDRIARRNLGDDVEHHLRRHASGRHDIGCALCGGNPRRGSERHATGFRCVGCKGGQCRTDVGDHSLANWRPRRFLRVVRQVEERCTLGQQLARLILVIAEDRRTTTRTRSCSASRREIDAIPAGSTPRK